MELAIGILLIAIGIIITVVTCRNFYKKRLTLVWGGFNILGFSVILVIAGVYIISN